jgi:hypothetical protein
MPKKNMLFGQFALQKGYINEQDLLSCLRIQKIIDSTVQKHFLIGEIMLLREALSPKKYIDLIREIECEETVAIMRAPLFGEVVVEHGFVTLDQLLECLDIQQQDELRGSPQRLLGEIMIEQGYLTPRLLQTALKIYEKQIFAPKEKR